MWPLVTSLPVTVCLHFLCWTLMRSPRNLLPITHSARLSLTSRPCSSLSPLLTPWAAGRTGGLVPPASTVRPGDLLLTEEISLTAHNPWGWLYWHQDSRSPNSVGWGFMTGWKCRPRELHVSFIRRTSIGVAMRSCSSFSLESEKRRWDQTVTEMPASLAEHYPKRTFGEGVPRSVGQFWSYLRW